MSAPAITTAFANPDPNTTVASLQDLVTQLNLLVTSSIQGTFVPYVLSSSTPAVSDQDKSWLKVDSAGRPLGVYIFYNGNWRRFYNGNYGEMKMFIGDPANYFDSTGLGKVGLDWDGWAVCNGNNSTPNLADKFVVFANNHATIDGYSAGNWLSTVTGSAVNQGGSEDFTITNNNLPNMKVQLSGKVGYDNNASEASNHAIVTTKWYASGNDRVIDLVSFGADPTGTPAVPQVAIPTVPPFVTACPTLWVGYT